MTMLIKNMLQKYNQKDIKFKCLNLITVHPVEINIELAWQHATDSTSN